MNVLDAQTCRQIERSAVKEWLETNGIGGYSSASVAGMNTRRYHGLLTAAARPPLGRIVMLCKLEEVLTVDGERFELSANFFGNDFEVAPKGFEFIEKFTDQPFPQWTLRVGGVVLERTILMIYGENSTVVEYRVVEKDSSVENVSLELRPLTAFRDYHALQHRREDFGTEVSIFESTAIFQPSPEMPALFLNFTAAETEKTGVWYENFAYPIERERGFDFTEDLFQPFLLRFDLSQNSFAAVIASTERRAAQNVSIYKRHEIERRQRLVEDSGLSDEFDRHLALIADQFIVKRGAGSTIIAGYHWFSDWGRDTMIALPGLTLTTKRFETARRILFEYSRHISRGMIPNRFPDAGETPEYNTVDATLWYFEAIRAYAHHTTDFEFIRENLYEKLCEIIDWHIRGTRFQIKLDNADGLLFAGEKGVQLTWMDAKIGDWVVTPRIGKPVEIQALWFNALQTLADFAEKFGDHERAAQCLKIAAQAKQNFTRIFWNDAQNCLFDYINQDEKNASIRPNQIFAVSLHHQILDGEKAAAVVQTVERELLTPIGLRSLARSDADYKGIYIGSPLERDGAYHQGTIWAWLSGAFLSAYAKTFADDAATPEKLQTWLNRFQTHFSDVGIGQISEIFDGDEPHTPRGCIAQAWSVGEILRASAEIRRIFR